MRKSRVGGLIIKDKKLLLVTAYHASFYWLPGGGIEEGEKVLPALERELEEELHIKVLSTKPYNHYIVVNQITGNEEMNYHYFVDIEDEPMIGGETLSLYWFSKEDFEKERIALPNAMKEILIPNLIAEGYL